MIEVTDRHCRVFLRLFSRRIRLYTEMIVTGSVIHGDRDRFLGFDSAEHPVAIQLGGSDPSQLSVCAGLAQDYGYDEVNLNVGCPSNRVKNGHFGACLMARPQTVADCVAAMCDTVSIPVTVKTRLGIDDKDSYEELVEFIGRVAQSGCEHFIIHARKAWLSGLSPKENRTIPPLHYDRVYRLKRDFPHLRFTLNGGVTGLDQVAEHFRYVDGVMIGREACHNPWMLRRVDSLLAHRSNPPYADSSAVQSRMDIVEAYLPYVEAQLKRGVYLRHMMRPMLGLFHRQAGAKSWRRYLSEYGPRKNAGIEVIESALKFVVEATDVKDMYIKDMDTKNMETKDMNTPDSCTGGSESQPQRLYG